VKRSRQCLRQIADDCGWDFDQRLARLALNS